MDKTKLAVDAFDHFALIYQSMYMDVELYKDSFDFFCDNVKKSNPHLLEVACGPGNISKYLMTKRIDFKLLATDLSTKMIKLAIKNVPNAQFKIMDCRKIKSLNKKFDGLMAGFALPYLSKEEAIVFIDDASKILNKDGLLYISTMEDDNRKSGPKPSSSDPNYKIFMNYHERSYLMEALQNSGFKLLEQDIKSYPDLEGRPINDLILIAQKT